MRCTADSLSLPVRWGSPCPARDAGDRGALLNERVRASWGPSCVWPVGVELAGEARGEDDPGVGHPPCRHTAQGVELG